MTKMRHEITEQLLVSAVRQGMDQAVIGLDWQTQAKLTQLRLQALELEPKRHWSACFNSSSLSRGFAVATAVTLAVTLWVLPDVVKLHPDEPVASGDNFTDAKAVDEDVNVMEILTASEDMELLENLDMYEWLEAEYG
ncbi:hypothetical protein SAMN05660964_02878 [Thiothrix caldifontis]|jgi:hypothetical protein|uniref:Uncharacterized protein n=1 Tax=Thiothrix caldifontis TaxID=525918 RepID=A0A1H4F8U1_9GAMM|nr:hypothetical protein [Thiothrix caldifontis]SEA93756.1 hypothetical protein SAMN05660964_02878 [Thiothrix caldifontis]